MKADRAFIVTLSLACGIAAASEWTDRIVEIVPASVTLTNIAEGEGYVDLTGTAPDNSDISVLMRAIAQANLGSPELERVTRTGDLSDFVLRVKAPR